MGGCSLRRCIFYGRDMASYRHTAWPCRICGIFKYGHNGRVRQRKRYKLQIPFYKWNINLENIENFSYSIGSHLAGPHSYSFDVCFHYNENGVKDYYKLNTKIGREDIRRCMDGESSKLEIMQIYRYAERLYPEKAKGYVQPESIF